MPTMPDPDDAPPPIRGPLQGLEDLSDFVADHPVNTGTFLRGMTIGALVGAAVAGLSIWRRLRRDREREDRATRQG
jgi:hypothetical protein